MSSEPGEQRATRSEQSNRESVGSWLPDREVAFPADDAFGVDELINQIVEQLAGAKPPFAVSLSGSWGVGKSTIAYEVRKRLRQRDVRCLYIDTWTLDVRHLRRHLVVEIGASLRTGDPQADPDPETRRKSLEEIDSNTAQTTEQGRRRSNSRSASETLAAMKTSLMTLINVGVAVVGLVAAGVVYEPARTFFFGLAGV